MAARSCQTVVAIEVPNEPATMRTKLDRPDAAGILSGVMPDSTMTDKGIKKNAMAIPWMIVGSIKVPKSAWVLNFERMNNTKANTTKAKLASQRASTLLMFLPTIGDRMMANKPTGASSMPASVEG